MEELVNEIVDELKGIYDNRDFVNGVMNKVVDVEDRERLLYYLSKAKKENIILSSSAVHIMAYLISNGRSNEITNMYQ